MELETLNGGNLIKDIRALINVARERVTKAVNSEMTMLYWHIGKRVNQDILQSRRAEYGKEVVASLAKILAAEYGNGFSRVSLIRMIQFYESFSNLEISSTLSNQLSWSHIIESLPLKGAKQKEFYAFMSAQGGWSLRQLRSNINKMTYERTLASRHSDDNLLLLAVKHEEELSPSIILKDPYVLDFLNLPNEHYENDLESAILHKIEEFILELGAGFSFVARQKRMTIDNEHFYLDLLFFNRRLKRLVAIELKSGKFKPEYKGQMELYLNWLKKFECLGGENSPIGIILCSEKSQAQIELLDMASSDIHVAEYWTSLPPIKVFEKKLQEIVIEARRLYEHRPEIKAKKS